MKTQSQIIIETARFYKMSDANAFQVIEQILKNQPQVRGPRMPYVVLIHELESSYRWSVNKIHRTVQTALNINLIKRQEVILPEARLREKQRWDDMHERGSFSGKLCRPEFETDYVVLWEYDEPPDAVKQEELGEIPTNFRWSKVKTVVAG